MMMVMTMMISVIILMILWRIFVFIVLILMVLLVIWCVRSPFHLIHILIGILRVFFVIGEALFIYWTLLLDRLTLCICILENWRSSASRYSKLTHIVVIDTVLSVERVWTKLLALRLFHDVIVIHV